MGTTGQRKTHYHCGPGCYRCHSTASHCTGLPTRTRQGRWCRRHPRVCRAEIAEHGGMLR